MNSVIFSSGQRIIKQILDWFQSGNQADIKNRINDYSQPGVCKDALNGLDIIAGTNNTLATPSVTVRTGVAYDVNGDRIHVSDEVTSYDPSQPLHTTDNGLGTPLLTPRSTGSLNVPLVPNSDNYVWIDYLETTDDSVFTLQKISNSKQFYKQTDGYKITATTISTPPTALSVLLAQINLVGGGVVNSTTIDLTVRPFSKILDYRVRITTNRTDRTDVPAVYNTGEIELFLDDHIHAVGNGPVTPTNPHGLTATDIGLTATTIEEHQRYLHTNGVIGNPASLTSSLYPFVTIVTPGLDFITVRKLLFGEQAVVNGLTINSANINIDTDIIFNSLDANGIWYIYLDSALATILKTQVDIVSVPESTKLVICRVTWTYPTAGGGDLSLFTDLRVFGNVATREIQDQAVTPAKINQGLTVDFVFPHDVASVRHVNANGTKATGTITVVDYLLLSGAVLTINGVALTEGVHWSAAGNNTAAAASLATAITTATATTTTTATSALSVITVTANLGGLTGNSITITTSDPVNLPLSNISGGKLIGGLDAKIKEQGNSLLPAGVILPFATNSAPSGFLLCDGTAVSRSYYAALFSVLGVTWGQGNNTTTFNLPDFRGRFLRGRDAGAGRDPNAGTRTASNTGGATGDNVGSVQGGATKLPNTTFTVASSGSGSFSGSTDTSGAHYHTYAVLARVGGNQTGSNWVPWVPAYDAIYNTGNTIANAASGGAGNQGAHSHSVSVSGPISVTGTVNGGGDSETRPVNANVLYIIKY